MDVQEPSQNAPPTLVANYEPGVSSCFFNIFWVGNIEECILPLIYDTSVFMYHSSIQVYSLSYLFHF